MDINRVFHSRPIWALFGTQLELQLEPQFGQVGHQVGAVYCETPGPIFSPTPSVAHSYLAVIQRFIFIRILCTVYTHQFRVPNICLGPLF